MPCAEASPRNTAGAATSSLPWAGPAPAPGPMAATATQATEAPNKALRSERRARPRPTCGLPPPGRGRRYHLTPASRTARGVVDEPTGQEFANADLRGARFQNVDLTGA